MLRFIAVILNIPLCASIMHLSSITVELDKLKKHHSKWSSAGFLLSACDDLRPNTVCFSPVTLKAGHGFVKYFFIFAEMTQLS